MLSETQREARKKGLGGSDISVIFGLSSYKTPYQLWLEKTGVVESSFEETQQQEWGHILEPVIRDYFCKRHGVTVIEPSPDEPPLVHPMFDFLLANIDGYVVEWDCIHEIKCSDKFMRQEWGDEDSDQIPLTYLLQIAHYCMIKNCEKAVLSVLIGGNEYREYTYYRDQALEDRIIEEATTFWDCVLNNTPPPPINIDDLKKMYCKPEPVGVTAPEELLKHIEIVKEAKLQSKELKEAEQNSKFEIMKYLGDAELLLDDRGYTVASWKANKKGVRTFLVKGM
jgi:putative phage-type endonuclease